jgi:RNA polymerase sigma-70 factor (ECF subfamily)
MCRFLVDISVVFRFKSEMTPKEFEHKVMEMRSQALSAALVFGFPMEEAEDVAQDVMLRLWAMHERIGAEDPVGVLARTAARHACIDRLRVMHPEEDFEQSEAGIERQTPSDELEYKELKEWLTRQMELLPPTLGIVLRMRQVERRSVQEISVLLGISERSVSTLLSRARHQLKEELEKRNNNI